MRFPFGIAIIALFVAVIMWLWNMLVPSITGWERIGFWQAAGLALLCRLLTGRIGTFRKPMERRRRMHLHEMPREERDRFIKERLGRLSRDNDER